MRMIDKDKLLICLSDHWLAHTPNDTDRYEKAEKEAVCRGIDEAIEVVESFPEAGLDVNATGNDWISVDERLPEQNESIFAKYYGTNKWSKAMWRMNSELVIVAIRFKDGTGIVRTGDLRDGEWYTSVSRVLEPVVTHWMHFPKEPVGVKLNYA